MEKFAKELLATLYSELQQVGAETDNNLQQYERSYVIATAKLYQLKDFMQGYTFKSDAEEILFFKEIKPQFLKEAIFFRELYDIESKRPILSDAGKNEYYEKVVDVIMAFFDKNRDLYNYYRTGKTNRDKEYFQRSNVDDSLSQHQMLDLDPRFSTTNSINFAYLQAYVQVCEYLNTTFYRKTDPVSDNSKNSRGSTWSNSKAALVELAIALYYSGSVNYGMGGLKKFISELEAFFHIQLGNISRVFISFMIRKKEPAPFLQQLIAAFMRKLDEKNL